MTDMNSKPNRVTLAIDAMGSDGGPETLLAGAALARERGLAADFLFVGPAKTLSGLIEANPRLAGSSILDAENVVTMTDKPMHVLRRGRDTSMWCAVGAVANGAAQAVVSGGNTGALMAVGRSQLGMIDGVDRPAISALWPTPRGRVVVLDVGANVEADDKQLVRFAIMGEAFFRALTGKEKPTVALLNVGAEELKGHELIRRAAQMLRASDDEMAFQGFVEGNDISLGAVDVVVTDGFTGNIALKSAEGAARLVGGWMKDALTDTVFSKIAALIMRPQLRQLKERIDPSSVNGGVFLGLNGIVVKSHGGADEKGVASAIAMAGSLSGKGFRADVTARARAVFERIDAQARPASPDGQRDVSADDGVGDETTNDTSKAASA